MGGVSTVARGVGLRGQLHWQLLDGCSMSRRRIPGLRRYHCGQDIRPWITDGPHREGGLSHLNLQAL